MAYPEKVVRRALAVAAVSFWVQAAAGKAKLGETEVGGRVFVRSTLLEEENRPVTSELEVASARVEVSHRWEWLLAVIEAELSEGAEIRDAFLRAKVGRLRIRAGQFKEPTSAIELASQWALPLVGRGVLDDVIVDRMQIGGRRPGVELEWREKRDFFPSLSVGVFQGSEAGGGLLDSARPEDQTIAARLSTTWGALEIGAFGENRATRVGTDVRHLFAAGFDLTMEHEFSTHAMRLWFVAMTAASWLDYAPGDDRNALMSAVRYISAWRYGGVKRDQFYVEPFVFLGFVDPDTQIRSDLVRERAIGVNVGVWKRARIGAEVVAWDAGRNAPLLAGGGTRLESGTAAMLQAAAAF